MKTLLLLLCVNFFTQSFSQITYQGRIASGQRGSLQGVIITSDNAVITYANNYITESYNNTLVSKVDKSGNNSWSKVYSIDGYRMVITSMVATGNGGFLAVANTDSTGKPSSLTIFKADSLGTIIWKKKLESDLSYGNFSSPTIATAIDGGFYLLYVVLAKNYNLPSEYVLSRYDKQGLSKWSNSFTLNENGWGSELEGMKETSDGNLTAIFGIRSCDAYCTYIEADIFSKDGSVGYEYPFDKALYAFGYPLFAGDENGDIHFLLDGSIDNYHEFFSYITVKPDSNKMITLNIKYDVYALQSFLRTNRLTMFQKQPFYTSSPAVFDADWALIEAGSYSVNNTVNIYINKHDSLGRICPAYTIPKVSYTIQRKEKGFRAYRYYLATTDAKPLTDATIIVTPGSSMNTICSGFAMENITATSGESLIVNNKNAYIAPNPATNTCVVHLTNAQAEQVLIKITDISGKAIITKTMLLQKGSNTIPLDVKKLKSGMYFIQLAGGKIHTTLKLMKL